MDKARLLEITRRDLLALGPVGALSAGVFRSKLAAAADLLYGADGRSDAHVSIGYWQGSASLEGFQALRHAPGSPFTCSGAESEGPEPSTSHVWSELVTAHALGRGDPRFARSGAKLAIHGLIAPESGPKTELPRMSLKVHYTPFHGVACDAWGYEGTEACTARPPTALTVPIAREKGLSLSFEIASGPVEPEAVVIRFSLGAEPGVPKLRRGVYFLAWGRKPLPSWRRYRVVTVGPDDDADRLDTRPDFWLVERGLGWKPADLSFAMLSVDFDGRGQSVHI